MEHPDYNVMWIVIALGIVVALCVYVWRKLSPAEAGKAENPTHGVATFAMNESATPFSGGASNGGGNGDDPPALVPAINAPRARDIEIITERIRAGMCLVCNERAVRKQPLRVQVNSWIDVIYRKIGAIAPTRYRIEFWHESAPYAFCEAHQREGAGRLNRFISEQENQRQEFELQQLLALEEFQKHGMYEAMAKRQESVLRAPTRSQSRGQT